MGDDVIQRLFDKIDDLRKEVGELSNKVVALETTLTEREKSGNNYVGLLAWLITTLMAGYAAKREAITNG